MLLKDLAAKHGHARADVPHGDPFDAVHACAATLHGWNRHEYHYGPVEISEQDYLAALESAGSLTVHEPANRRSDKGPPSIEDPSL